MRLTLIGELASNHGGDIDLAERMIRAAAECGCDLAKTQAYDVASINPDDPQREWLARSVLSRSDHERLRAVCAEVGIGYLSTPFDAASLQMLREIGQTTFKIASSESGAKWWQPHPGESWFVSYPWGILPKGTPEFSVWQRARLTAIPLYPTPLEAVGRATLLDGFSDHCVGLAACKWAIAQGAQVIEAHLCFAESGRRMAWDKLPMDFATLRRFADDVTTIRTGVSQQFRERWKR